MTIEERAEKYASPFSRSEQHFAEECYIAGATEQQQIDIYNACDVYRNELQEIINLLDKVGENYNIEKLGEILSLDGCVNDFRKAMEEQR